MLPPPVPNKKSVILRHTEVVAFLPSDEGDNDVELVAIISNKTLQPKSSTTKILPPPLPLTVQSKLTQPNSGQSKPVLPPINIAARKEESKAEKEKLQNSSIVRSIVEQKRKKERKTLVVTFILSVLGVIIFTILTAYLLSPTQLQKYETPENTKIINHNQNQNNQNESKTAEKNEDITIELIEPTEDESEMPGL
ncbi:MAG: hypothetical protein LBP59_19935 [Planctomycetaceae bacterium]|jgi:ATP-dependent Zn protease|nr:hypothetical protein [Planctomycetaceae bacterium]